jgi:hypothetical protein
MSSKPCRHHDIQVFDGLRCCLACGEAVFNQAPSTRSQPHLQASGQYSYNRLNYELGQEIRLLVLHPEQDNELHVGAELQCDITHANLMDRPVYEALSYTWASQDGDDSLSGRIVCRSTGDTIAITKTCEAALRCLRLRGRKRILWVDALSIDQQNVSERSAQVKLMGQIYSNASQVLMYLGPGSEATDRVMDFLNGEKTLALWSNSLRRNADINKFLHLRYFDRVRVLQEIALAKLTTLIVGNKVARWSASSIRDIQTHTWAGDIPIPSALQWHHSSELERDFLKVLQKSRNCSASDPKDKVYAVLGLVQPDVIKYLVVNYSLSLEDVYLNVAEHLIMEHNCLNLLKHVARDSGQPRVGRLSTWVPEWHEKISYSTMLTQFDAREMTELNESWYRSEMLKSAEHVRFIGGMSNHDFLDHELSSKTTRSTARWFERISEALLQPHELQHDLSLYISHRFSRDSRHQIVMCDEPWVPTSTCPLPPRRILRVRAHALDRIPSTYTNDRPCDLVALYADPPFHLRASPWHSDLSCAVQIVLLTAITALPSLARLVRQRIYREPGRRHSGIGILPSVTKI